MGLPECFGHGCESYSGAVGRGGEVGAEAGQGRDRRTALGVLVGTLVGKAGPARAVVVAGVVGAEALDEAGCACVAVAHQPFVPVGAGFVGGVKELFVAGGLCELPCCRGDRHDHLDLSEACFLNFVVCGKLAVGALELEEGHVAVAGYVGAELAVDEGLVGAALHPDALVDRAFDEDGLVVARHLLHVGGEDG